jgi:hypothetical protein
MRCAGNGVSLTIAVIYNHHHATMKTRQVRANRNGRGPQETGEMRCRRGSAQEV